MARIDPTTISQIITGLEKKKLIRREASPDEHVKNPKLNN